MKNRLAIMCCVVLNLCESQVIRAATSLASWGFETPWTDARTVTLDAGLFDATLLSGTPQLVATESDPNGVVHRGPGNVLSGNGMEFKPSAGGNGNGSTFILQLTLASAINNVFTVTYLEQVPLLGETDLNSWDYSTDHGVNWISITTRTASGTGFNPYSLDVNLNLSAGTDIWFRDTLLGATSPGNNVDFDNIGVLVPEPVNMALGVLAAGFVGLLGGRRFYRWVTVTVFRCVGKTVLWWGGGAVVNSGRFLRAR